MNHQCVTLKVSQSDFITAGWVSHTAGGVTAHTAYLLWAAVFNQILAKASQESGRVFSAALGSYFNQEILFVSHKNQSDCSCYYSQAYSSFFISPQLNPIGHWLGACTWELLIQLTISNIQPAECAVLYEWWKLKMQWNPHWESARSPLLHKLGHFSLACNSIQHPD